MKMKQMMEMLAEMTASREEMRTWRKEMKAD
jgi:hypothetical protein